MPRGYIPSPQPVPYDPAFYDSLAAGAGPGILEGIGDVARGAFSYVQNKAAGDQREKTARALLDALITDNVPPETAKVAVLEYVQAGTQELLKAWANRQTLAADLKAKEATTFKTREEAFQVRPTAQATQATERAQGRLYEAQAEDVPLDTEIARGVMETGRQQAETERDRLTADIDKETRDFVMASDVNRSGTIDPNEARDLLSRNRAKVRENVRKIKLKKADPFDDDPETTRYRSMGSAEIDEEAKRLTREQIDDINFGRANAMDIVGGGGDTVERDIASLRAAKEGNFGKYRSATLDEGIDFGAGGVSDSIRSQLKEEQRKRPASQFNAYLDRLLSMKAISDSIYKDFYVDQ